MRLCDNTFSIKICKNIVYAFKQKTINKNRNNIKG